MLRTMIVDDHIVLRNGIVGLLSREEDFEVVAEAGDGKEAVELALRLRPDLVVMDIGLPKLNGIEATRQIKERCPDTRVIALTMFEDEASVLDMLASGADGYLSKTSSFADLVQGIRAALRKTSLLSPSVARILAGTARGIGRESLTGRERDVLKLMVAGATSKAIAARLYLSQRTVEKYRARILDKLGARNTAEAIALALERRIIPASTA